MPQFIIITSHHCYNVSLNFFILNIFKNAMKKYFIIIALTFLTACNEKSEDKVVIDKLIQSTSLSETPDQFKSAHKEEKVEYSDLTEFKVLSITEGEYENTPALQINLTLPIDKEQNVSQKIQVNNNHQRVSGDWIYGRSESVLYFPFIKAETQYEVIVDKNLNAFNGKKITKGVVKNLTTKPYEKSVKFTSSGNTLLKDSNVLPIEAVNVDAVDMKFWRIRAEKYTEFLNMSYRNEIYSLERLYQIADVVFTGQFSLDSIKNKREKHNVSIKHIDEVQKAGLYFVTMMPKDVYSYQIESTWFMNTDIGLHSRSYDDSVVVFTHKIPVAKIYPNIEISLLDNKGNILDQQTTGAEGFAELSSSKLDKAVLLLARKGDNLNLIRLKKAQMDLSEFDLVNRKSKQQELFIYGPRNLYRPGETVNINALLRNYDGQYVRASPIKVTVKRPDNRVVKSFDWQGDDSSLYETEFNIANDAMTGMWSFHAKLANKDEFEYQFAVEDFLPERLKLELKSSNDLSHIVANATPTIKVQSDYLYGAPAANNRFDATISIRPETKLFDYNGFVFGAKHYRDYTLNYDTKKQNLDNTGYGEIKLKNKWKETTFPLKINSYVTVYESGGRPISRNIVQTVWPQTVAIGVRPLWEGDYASPQSNNKIELIAVNQQGKKVDLPNADILLIRENDNRYWQWGDDGWSYNNSHNNQAVFNSVININKNTKTIVNMPLDYGSYRVEIRNQQHQLLSSYRFFSGWRWYNANNESSERPDRVKLAWQADFVTAGEKANLKITAPYAGIALVTIESNKVLYQRSFQMTDAEEIISIPIAKDWNSHDIYASVMVIREGEIKRKHLPVRSFGILHMPLNRDNRELKINIENPKKIVPESNISITIKANNLDLDKDTFVTLAAVDTGVLNISRFATPNPFEWFFSKRRYIAEIRDIYGSIIAFGEGKDAIQKFGGDGDVSRGGDEPTSEVQIVSLFSKKVKFNQLGVAIIDLEVPYFNGELRLMAMAYNDSQFAGVDSKMTVAAPIVVSASMPRFMAKGDKSYAIIDIHNTEDFDQSINLELSADNALGEYSTKLQVQLKANEKNILQLPIKAKFHSGLGHIRVKANITGQNNYQLDRQWQLGIRPAYPAITQSNNVVIEKGTSFQFSTNSLQKFEDENLKSILKVSNVPVLNADEHLLQLIQYPYGCLEQTSSRVWPLLSVEESDFGLFASAKQHEIFSNRNKLVDDAISRLIGMQRYDGSFGLWSKDSYEEKWLTVYVTDLLLNAKNIGYDIPEEALQKAIKRLVYYVQGRHYVGSDIARYLSNKNHYLLAYQAYAAYVLASIKQVNLQDVRKLYDNNYSHAKRPLPLAHLAMALELLGDDRRANEAWLKAFDFKSKNDNNYYADYGSSIRDMSQIILLSNQSHLTKNLAKSAYQLLTPLQDKIKQRQWFSTQERGALFRLAKSLKKNRLFNKHWQANISRNNNQDVFNQYDDLTKIWYQKEAKTEFEFTNTGDQPLFIDFKTQGYLNKPIPQNNGITVERNYFDTNGKQLDITQLATGDLVLVYIQVKLEGKDINYLPDAILVELLPAGLELENQNLEHAFKIDNLNLNINNKKQTIWDWQSKNIVNHSEYRDDRFISAISLSRYRPTHVFYLARAVTPGEYTIPPTLVEDMYRPEIRAIGESRGIMFVTE